MKYAHRQPNRNTKLEGRSPTLSRSALFCSLAALAAATPAFIGCAADATQQEDTDSVESAVIGGSAVSVATRRSLGLIDVNGNNCSGSLISPHWVLTATHCLDFAHTTSNTFEAPRTDGTNDQRIAVALSRVGTGDMALAQLSTPSAGMTWPSVSRSMSQTIPEQLLNQNITCYGHGATGYATPSGLQGAGPWRSLVRSVAQFDGFNLWINATNGNNILAPADSGGPCLSGNSTVGIASFFSSFECANNSTLATCAATLTKINNSALASTYGYANYINFAPSRTATATFRELTPNAGWSNAAFSANNVGVIATAGNIRLRGALSTTGTSNYAFSLPLGYRPSNIAYVSANLCGGFKGRLVFMPTGEVYVYAEGGAWVNAQCFTSLDGVSFSGSAAGATALALRPGWTNAPFNTRNAAARVVSGMVELQGAVASGPNSTVFTLPVGFRPPTQVFVLADLCAGAKGRLSISPNGDVTIQPEGAFSDAQCFTSLEGISFALSNAGFTSLTPLNGWTGAPYSTRNPAVANIAGMVRFQGAIATTGNNQHAFTLPEAMRPATVAYIPIDMCASRKGRLVVQADGRVFVESAGSWSSARCFASLEGAAFGL